MHQPAHPKILKANWPAPPHIQGYTTLRDQALPSDLPEKPRILHQVHGSHIINWDQRTYQENIQADGSWTTKENIVCCTKTADCLPVFFTDQEGSFVASIHAGWRGLASKILTKTMQAIQKNPSTLLIWLGPAIGPKSFEVQKDVVDQFDFKQAFIQTDEVHWLCDIYALAISELSQLGVQENQIYGGGLCTYSDPTLFDSYRRDKNHSGRMFSMIWKNTRNA